MSVFLTEVECLRAELSQAREELRKKDIEIGIRQRAVDRWVPCPDHRDKINTCGVPQCQVCRAESAETQLAVMAEALKAYAQGEVRDFGAEAAKAIANLPARVKALQHLIKSALSLDGCLSEFEGDMKCCAECFDQFYDAVRAYQESK